MNKATWILHNNEWKCSHCKNKAIKMAGGGYAITHYCSNCGKFMTEGLKNGRH